MSETNTANARLSVNEIYTGVGGGALGAFAWFTNTTVLSPPETNYYVDDIGELKAEINALTSFSQDAVIMPDKLQARIDAVTQKELAKDYKELQRFEALQPDPPSMWVKIEGLGAMCLIGVAAFVGTTYAIRNTIHRRKWRAEKLRQRDEHEKELDDRVSGEAANIDNELRRFLQSLEQDENN